MWSLWVYRPSARYVAWLFLKLGISANQITAIGAAVGIAGCTLLAFSSYWMVIAGVALIVLHGILDCTDGAIARVTKTTSKYGLFLDIVSGHMMEGLIPLSVSIGLYWGTGLWPYLILGGFCTFIRLLGNIETLAYNATFSGQMQDIASSSKLAKWGAGLAMLEVPVLIICVIPNCLEVFLVLFTAIFTSKAVALMYIIRKETAKPHYEEIWLPY